MILSFCVSPPPSLLRNSVARSHRTCNALQLSQKPMLVLIFLPLPPKCLIVGHKLQHIPSYTSQSYTHTTELYTIKTSGKLASLYWTRLKIIKRIMWAGGLGTFKIKCCPPRVFHGRGFQHSTVDRDSSVIEKLCALYFLCSFPSISRY